MKTFINILGRGGLIIFLVALASYIQIGFLTSADNTMLVIGGLLYIFLSGDFDE